MKNMTETLLEVKNLTVRYQTRHSEIVAADGLCFNVLKGEFVAVIGKSGCGKTSVLSAVAGLIDFDGEIIFSENQGKNADRATGYMLQKDELFPWLTVEQNALLPLKIKRKLTQKNKARVNGLLDKYGLKDFKHRRPDELSGGMRQRVALIRTLALSPELLLLDEPFSALDFQTRLTVCDDVYSVIKNEKKTALLVTHDISEAISVADKILVLSARPAKILAEERLNFDKSLTPLMRREQPSFSAEFEKLWRLLNGKTKEENAK